MEGKIVVKQMTPAEALNSWAYSRLNTVEGYEGDVPVVLLIWEYDHGWQPALAHPWNLESMEEAETAEYIEIVDYAFRTEINNWESPLIRADFREFFQALQEKYPKIGIVNDYPGWPNATDRARFGELGFVLDDAPATVSEWQGVWIWERDSEEESDNG